MSYPLATFREAFAEQNTSRLAAKLAALNPNHKVAVKRANKGKLILELRKKKSSNVGLKLSSATNCSLIVPSDEAPPEVYNSHGSIDAAASQKVSDKYVVAKNGNKDTYKIPEQNSVTLLAVRSECLYSTNPGETMCP